MKDPWRRADGSLEEPLRTRPTTIGRCPFCTKTWAAAGLERGFRSAAEATSDLDALEKRMHDLIPKIREAAGYTAPEPDEGHSESQPG